MDIDEKDDKARREKTPQKRKNKKSTKKNEQQTSETTQADLLTDRNNVQSSVEKSVILGTNTLAVIVLSHCWLFDVDKERYWKIFFLKWMK